MSQITSTVPGALQVLHGYMEQVAQERNDLDIGVYYGKPTGELKNYYLMVGDPETDQLFSPIDWAWVAIPGTARIRPEAYSLLGAVRTYAGPIDKHARVAEGFSLIDSLHELIVSDIGGSGRLSPSGSWGRLTASQYAAGSFGAPGWGVMWSLELTVINAQING